jgi:hypothetical protein
VRRWSGQPPRSSVTGLTSGIAGRRPSGPRRR